MQQLISEVRRELTDHILPFWKGLRDNERGGYVGQVDFDLTRRPDAPKGGILNSRILWFFSETYLTLGDPALLEEAHHAYEMLCRMLDKEHGGIYWALNADGTVVDGTKHTYNQAFAIYALSAYYRAGGKEEALQKALSLFELVEDRCFDGKGYLEAFTADWRPAGNEKLGGSELQAKRTMNTLLHVLEGYTGLFEASRSEKVREKLVFILNLWAEKFYNPEKRRQEVFFDLDYNSLLDMHSFGHDIETSWLADHTLEALGDEELAARVRPRLLSMADHTLAAAFTDHGFANESMGDQADATRIWWVQAEALMGFLNAWQKTGEQRYLDAFTTQWRYIKDKLVDPRPGSEWYWCLSEDGTPMARPIVEPWKCPYHNGRMCLEVIRRLDGSAHIG